MPYKDKQKQNEYQLNWMRKRRESYFQGRNCVSCGSIEDLELDHIDRNTKVDHRIWSWSQKRLDVELAKCQPLCRKCHIAKSNEEQRVPIQHGTRDGYNNHGCRCEPCKESSSQYLKQWNMARSSSG